MENTLDDALKTLKRRESMLAAINEMATHLLSHENKIFGDVMGEGLKPISEAAGIDRIAVYRYLDQYLRFSQVYLWIGKTVPLEDFMLDMPIIPPISTWHSSFIKGECVNANLEELPEEEVVYLKKFGIKSICMVPVFTYGKLWGAITLEDHTRYRYFSPSSLDLLRSAAHICAGAVVREEMKREINDAEHANKTKSRFLAMMSHEIRTPLTVIATGIDFADEKISKGSSVPIIRNALDVIRKETQRLGRMVNGMLNLASISDTDEVRKRVDFSALLNDSAEVFRLTLEKLNNTLVVNISPGLPDVFVEADRFTQIITNILTNAAGHTQNGTVTISTEYDETFITVRITDTGVGINPDILPFIFEYGISGRENTGYGLYLCKTIVEAHGGSIEVESKLGKGTTIMFTVPVYGGQEEEQRK